LVTPKSLQRDPFENGLNVQKEEEEEEEEEEERVMERRRRVAWGPLLYSCWSLFLDLPLKGALIMLTREPRARKRAPKPKDQPLTRTV
jgi:hypothetical protein